MIKLVKFWQAVVKVQVPGGGQSWNGSMYQKNTIGQIVTFTVPDAGGYFSTKAALEQQFGHGSVQSLTEKLS
jgi:hypothetical protein